MPASIFNGSAVKILKNILRFKDGTDLSSTDAANLSGLSSNVQDQLDDKIDSTEKGANNGVATLDAGGKVPVTQLPNSIMEYLGTWAASTNTPTLADGVGNAGDVYIASDSGTVNFGSGNISFVTGDWVVYSGTVWQKSSNANSVVSVNGQTGVVSLDTDDIAEAANLYFTDERAQDAVGTILTDGSQIDFTYNDGVPSITASVVPSSLTDTEISAGAAIDRTKLASGSANRVVVNNGSGQLSDAAAITASRALESDSNGIPVASATTATELGYVSGVTSAIQTQLNGKEPTITGAATTITSADLTIDRALISNASGKVAVSPVTSTELGYLDDARSNVQTQIDGQAAANSRNLNWITNYGAEVDATGYAAYADAAQSTPVDGTGGSPTVTIARTTSSPLDGVASLEFVKDAANRQGEGFSYDFTVDRAYQATQQQISFNYEVASGTYVDGDMTVWLYDVTNAVLLSQPAGNSILASTLVAQQGQCTIQLNSNSTSYRLIFHVASTSASAYTLKFDNVSVGPQIQNQGYAATSPADFTPTFSNFGTVTNIDVDQNREGAFLVMSGRFQAGTVVAGEARISFPAGLVSASTLPTISICGKYVRGNTVTDHGGVLLIEPSVGYVTFSSNGVFGSTSTSPIAKANGSGVAANNEVISFEFRVQIAGWGSNTVVSTSANTRAVVFTGTQVSQALTANVTDITFTSTKDSVAGWSTNAYTVRVPGDYCVAASIIVSGAAALHVYKNGSIFARVGGDNNAGFVMSGTVLVQNCVVGDTISVRSNTSITGTNGTLSIFMLQAAQQIAASEVVSFAATTSNTAATTSAPFIFTSETFDTHNAYSTSTGIFTAPAPGYYQFNSGIVSSSGTNNIGIYKNGTLLLTGGSISTTVVGTISALVTLAAGDTIQIRPSGNTTGAGSATATWFNGFRIAGVA